VAAVVVAAAVGNPWERHERAAVMTKATLVEQAPVLLVSDLPASVDYWRDCLGFKARVYGEPPDFAILKRDTCFVMLAQAPDGHIIVPHWKIRDKTWNAYFWVDDAIKLHDEFLASGAKIDYTPGKQPYGVLEFGIQDLDGHDISFGQDLE
jgi:catechol 2,3-dioxygenase-like lactoylglutathione lyase family enzyme